MLKLQPDFLLATFSKMWEGRDSSRPELLGRKESGFDDLGNSQYIQITKDAKIGRFIVRKHVRIVCVDNILLVL